MPQYLLPNLEPFSDNPVLFFDGECNVCNRTVQFILQNEQEPFIQFCPLQSDFMERIYEQKPELQKMDTIFLVDGQKVYTHSDAGIQIAYALKKPYIYLCYLRWIPNQLRNLLYKWFARNRYKWFGKRETCLLPTPEIRMRFLDTASK